MNAASIASGLKFALFGAALLANAPAWAGDVHDLNRGLPLDFEDATPSPQGDVSVQLSARYEHNNDGEDQLTLEPQIQWGFAPNAHLQVQAPFHFGDADRSGSGDVAVGVLYNFLQEEGWRPALAVNGVVFVPSGEGNDGLDTELSLIATKTLTSEPSQDRLHLNVRWTRNAAEEENQRHDRFAFVAAYSRKLDDDTVFVADFIREQQDEEHQDSNIVEAGVIRSFGESVTAGFGVGTGIGDDSPNVLTSLSVQIALP
ncbi:MAG TPA: transporter [Tepidisphaeraceae bacterium]|jgi:hypothetical protein